MKQEKAEAAKLKVEARPRAKRPANNRYHGRGKIRQTQQRVPFFFSLSLYCASPPPRLWPCLESASHCLCALPCPRIFDAVHPCSILCISNETHSAESTWLGPSVVSNEPGVWSLILIEIGLVWMGTEFLSLLFLRTAYCVRASRTGVPKYPWQT